ncbi:MAG: Membrane protein involved in colicin uptake [Candidatus Saccharibacteria bacterium]|nr:Membrane protein involved in colicin uptake [Candidatus Saccharibacteria bacterium]
MVERIEQVKQVSEDGRTARTSEVVDRPDANKAAGQTIVARVVWYIAGVLLTLLAFRFVLALLGANRSNAFADFIFGASHPFVAPFFSLFGYDMSYGASHVETYTLVAMAVYALVAYGIARLVTINRAARAA